MTIEIFDFPHVSHEEKRSFDARIEKQFFSLLAIHLFLGKKRSVTSIMISFYTLS